MNVYSRKNVEVIGKYVPFHREIIHLPYSNFLEGLYGNKGCEDFVDKLRPLQTDEVEQEC